MGGVGKQIIGRRGSDRRDERNANNIWLDIRKKRRVILKYIVELGGDLGFNVGGICIGSIGTVGNGKTAIKNVTKAI